MVNAKQIPLNQMPDMESESAGMAGGRCCGWGSSALYGLLALIGLTTVGTIVWLCLPVPSLSIKPYVKSAQATLPKTSLDPASATDSAASVRHQTKRPALSLALEQTLDSGASTDAEVASELDSENPFEKLPAGINTVDENPSDPKAAQNKGDGQPSIHQTPHSQTGAWAEIISSPTPGNQPEELQLDTIVVCPADWQQDMRPWLDYRTAQGRTIGLVDTPQTAVQLKDLLLRQHKLGLKYVLLVGDVPSRFAFSRNGIPTGFVPCEVSGRFGGPEIVATDNWYADLDGDHAPDLAIGRWSVDRQEEIQPIISKTLRFETDPDLQFAKKRIEFVAGVGGFGFLEDKLIENTATRLLTDLIPGQYHVHMTHASWRSVYCPGPENYQQKFFDSLNRGALFWVYMGHGAPWGLDSARFPDREVNTITTKNTEKLTGTTPSIALLLACSTGEFANRNDCLAESMLVQPAGPVAVLAGTGVTAPFGLATLGFEMLTSYRTDSPKELGVWVQQAKRSMVLKATENRKEQDSKPSQPTDSPANSSQSEPIDYQKMLTQMAKLFSPTSDILDQEINEHAEMMTLFGDPLLRLPQFSDISLQASAQTDGSLRVTGQLPASGPQAVDVELEVLHPLDRIGFRPKSRTKYVASQQFNEGLAEDYQRANDRVIDRVTVQSIGGKFSIPAAKLSELPNRVWVRASVHSGTARGLGFCELLLNQGVDQIVKQVSAASTKLPADNAQEKEENSPATAQKPQQKSDDPFANLPQADDTYLTVGQPIQLFDKTTLAAWTKTNFGGEQDVEIEDGIMTLSTGYPMTGITFKGIKELSVDQVPKENYELQLRIKKVDGVDFFCGLTFPIGDAYCSFIAGGWGGMTVGLSSVDGKDAARNDTRSLKKFENGRWYLVRIRVTRERVAAWIDQEKVADQPRQGHTFSVRPEVRLSQPIGLSTYQTTAAVSDFRLIRLQTKESHK